jgi:uncharacterized protein (TIGR01370 family)
MSEALSARASRFTGLPGKRPAEEDNFEPRTLRCLAGATFFLICLCGTAIPGSCRKPEIRSWLCYYGTTFGAKFYSKFDLVVLDGSSHPPVEHSSPRHPTLLGYLSVGEVDIDGPYWEQAEGKPFLARKNEFWDSWMVDVRHPEWEELLLSHAVPAIMEKGFDGLFLDTLDSALFLEEYPENGDFAGAGSALVRLITEMKKRNPDMLIAVNRGLPILSEIAPSIDFLVVEDLYSYYSDEAEDYVRVEKDIQDLLLQQVAKGREAKPDLPVLTLDYAAVDQNELIHEAIAFSRKRKFVPYISTLELNDIYYHAMDN